MLDVLANDENTHTIVYTSPEFQPCSETFSNKYAFVGPSVRPSSEEIRKVRHKGESCQDGGVWQAAGKSVSVFLC